MKEKQWAQTVIILPLTVYSPPVYLREGYCAPSLPPFLPFSLHPLFFNPPTHPPTHPRDTLSLYLTISIAQGISILVPPTTTPCQLQALFASIAPAMPCVCGGHIWVALPLGHRCHGRCPSFSSYLSWTIRADTEVTVIPTLVMSNSLHDSCSIREAQINNLVFM